MVDDALLPDRAVLDASLLAGVPPAVTADTGMDVLTHAAEGCVAKKATPFSDAMGEKAFSMAWHSLSQAYAGDGGAKGEMLLASCMAGISFNAAELGICHALAHALGGRYHIPHGRLNAMLLPHIIAFNSADKGAADKYARLAGLCGLAKNARALMGGVRRLRAGLDMPEKLTDCGVEGQTLQADLDGIAETALADVCAPGNPRPAAREDLKAILKELM